MKKIIKIVIKLLFWILKNVPNFIYFVFLFLGIKAAIQGDLCLTIFFSMYCMGESIASSIDQAPFNRKITTTEAARILGSQSHKKKKCNQPNLFE